MEVSKKKFIIILILLIILALFPVVMISHEIISQIMLVKNTEKTISKIDVDELEKKFIQELKNTPLNVNTTELTTTFEKYNEGKNKDLDKVLGSDNNYDDFIFLIIKDNDENYFYYPCFKIVADKNDKVKEIQYIYTDKIGFASYINTNTIYKVLKENYNIDSQLEHITNIRDNDYYSFRYMNGKFYYSKPYKDRDYNYEFGVKVIKEVTNNDELYIKSVLRNYESQDIKIFRYEN